MHRLSYLKINKMIIFIFNIVIIIKNNFVVDKLLVEFITDFNFQIN